MSTGETEAVAVERPRGPAVVAVLTAAVLFGTSGTARELGPDDASSLSVGAMRILIGSLVLWAVVVARRRPMPSSADLERMRPLLAIGGVGVALYTPLFFVAVDRAGVAVGTVVTIASGPFFAALIDRIVRGVAPAPGWWSGTAATVIGTIVLVLSAGDGSVGVDLVGVAAALGAGCGYATYSVTSKATMDRGLDSTSALAVPFSIGVVVVLALSVRESFEWVTTSEGAAMALYLGIAATGVAYVAFGAGLRHLPSSTAVTLVLAEPLTATLLAVVVLDESIPVIGWVGVAVVAAGLWQVGRSSSRA